jgi:rubrerythrin
MDIKKIFEYALQREEEGQKFFTDNAGRFGHAAVVGIFKTLAAEEQRHIEFIQGHLKTLAGEEGGGAAGDLAGTDFFQQAAALEKIDQTVLESFVPALPVLRMAYLIERDFVEFYEMAAGRTTGKSREVLQMLAAWERGHEKLFKTLHDRAFEEYAHMPWGG